jgi:hypothetical protein
MDEEPRESPKSFPVIARVPAWRAVLGIVLWACAAAIGLLATLMFWGGFRWLYVELSNSRPLSLSLALLGGAIISATVSAGFAWLAIRTTPHWPGAAQQHAIYSAPISASAEESKTFGRCEEYVRLRRRYWALQFGAFAAFGLLFLVASIKTKLPGVVATILTSGSAIAFVVITFKGLAASYRILFWPCPRCGRSFVWGLLSRWPGDNCKHCGFSIYPYENYP